MSSDKLERRPLDDLMAQMERTREANTELAHAAARQVQRRLAEYEVRIDQLECARDEMWRIVQSMIDQGGLEHARVNQIERCLASQSEAISELQRLRERDRAELHSACERLENLGRTQELLTESVADRD